MLISDKYKSMKKTSTIQEAMFLDMKNKNLFDKAQEFGFRYLQEALDRNIYPTKEAIDDLKFFDEDMPGHSSDATSIINLLNKYGSPATVNQVGGRYFGFVEGGIVPAGLAAKNLASFWDQNAAMYVLSPITATLEKVVEKWLKQIFHLPAGTVAGFVSGTSTANFCGLAAARYRQLKNMHWDVNEKGLFAAPRLRIVTGKQAHSAILRAIGLSGLGKENIEWIDVDDQGRIIPSLIPELDDTTILILQAGNVNTGSFDDFSVICEKAKKSKAWIHIDGAFGLWASASKQLKHLIKGIEHADSWAVDGHKTLNTPYDSGIIMCSDKEAITSALHMSGSYIVVSEDRDGMYYTPEMSRRSRTIELWATLKYLGKDGMDEMILGMHKRANQFAEEIKNIEGFQVLNDVVFNQVLVCCKTDELTIKTMQRVQELRECWAGGSIWNNKKVIRVSVCSWATTKEDISRSVKSFEKALKEVS